MAAVGDLDRFLKYKAAKALGDAATSGGGVGGGTGASAGLGMGLGAGLGMMLPGMLFQVLDGTKLTPEQLVAKGAVNCPECQGEGGPAAKRCTLPCRATAALFYPLLPSDRARLLMGASATVRGEGRRPGG